jgi:hypothetical protein
MDVQTQTRVGMSMEDFIRQYDAPRSNSWTAKGFR